jgi:hypothetical protein
MDVQGVSLSTANSMDVQGISLSPPAVWTGCIPFYGAATKRWIPQHLRHETALAQKGGFLNKCI